MASSERVGWVFGHGWLELNCISGSLLYLELHAQLNNKKFDIRVPLRRGHVLVTRMWCVGGWVGGGGEGGVWGRVRKKAHAPPSLHCSIY